MSQPQMSEGFWELIAAIDGAIPIYTVMRPHPTRKRKADCEIEKQYKKGLQLQMKKELEQLPRDRWEMVVNKYSKKVKDL